MPVAAALVLSALVLRAADRYYYRDSDRVLRLLRLVPAQPGQDRGYYRRFDAIFAWAPFAWVWCDIFAALHLAKLVGSPLAWVPVAIFVGGRFRALQEVSHAAVHNGLCRSRGYQWALANVAVQWPLFRPDMHYRFAAHVTEHHAHANEPGEDPNIGRFQRIGVIPGLSRAQWRRKVWYPLSPIGLAETARGVAESTLLKNKRPFMVLPRVGAVAAAVALVIWDAGWFGLGAGFVLPLLVVYPFFSWISLLAEHRWFVRCEALERKARECINGRPTDYRGALGVALEHLIFPFSDHYHLAHSLYPLLRWNYLPAVDRALKAGNPEYARYASLGLIRASGDREAALSELRARLTVPGYHDIADWAQPGTRTCPPQREMVEMGA
ncbi:MAG TPA: fatty acid desaturase [Acidimicrobiales bacterium]|nr:fatty acid desaturase [Acidimicrobiales bacterium]